MNDLPFLELRQVFTLALDDNRIDPCHLNGYPERCRGLASDRDDFERVWPHISDRRGFGNVCGHREPVASSKGNGLSAALERMCSRCPCDDEVRPAISKSPISFEMRVIRRRRTTFPSCATQTVRRRSSQWRGYPWIAKVLRRSISASRRLPGQRTSRSYISTDAATGIAIT